MSMTNPENFGSEAINEQDFLDKFSTSGNCFCIVGGYIGDQGETTPVEIANYGVSIADLANVEKHVDHAMLAGLAPAVTLPLEIPEGFDAVYDDTYTWLGSGTGTLLHVADQKVPARIVSADFADFTMLWLQREDQPAAS